LKDCLSKFLNFCFTDMKRRPFNQRRHFCVGFTRLVTRAVSTITNPSKRPCSDYSTGSLARRMKRENSHATSTFSTWKIITKPHHKARGKQPQNSQRLERGNSRRITTHVENSHVETCSHRIFVFVFNNTVGIHLIFLNRNRPFQSIVTELE
jgi:hypothetical protein